jgi:hypothetical protein
VLAAALGLDEQARAELSARRLAGLDSPAEPGAEAAWAREMERRAVSIESGVAHVEPWDDVGRRIERDAPGR